MSDPEVITYLKEKKTDLPEGLLKDMPCVLKHASVVRGVINIASEFLRIQETVPEEVFYITERPLFSQKVLENNLNMLEEVLRPGVSWIKATSMSIFIKR